MGKNDIAEISSSTSRSSIEEVVIRICQELLNLQQVRVDDNFLLLGGESLLATQAASRLRDVYGLDVPLRSILVGTVAELAQEIADGLNNATK